MELSDFQNNFTEKIKLYLNQRFINSEAENYKKLFDSMNYSLFSSGKRFRPYLTYIIGEAFESDFEKTWWAGAAVEFIHTYSLIHDDLPCMDNDDYRRGQLTNHKVFGESMALLAGDALLTEAFELIAGDQNSYTAFQKAAMVTRLSRAAGATGMIAGQVMDMAIDLQDSLATHSYLQKMHLLKTAQLIEVSGQLGLLASVEKPSEKDMNAVSGYSVNLGLSFQIQDDILDYNSEKIGPKNMARVFGLKKAELWRDNLSQAALNSLKDINLNSTGLKNLKNLIESNSSRGH